MAIRIIDIPPNPLDKPVPNDTLVQARQFQQYRASHYAGLREEIQKRDAELIKNRRRELDDMAVRLVEFSQRKMPRSKVGKFTTLTDVQEAIDHLQNLPAGKAIEVDINDADYTALKKDGTEDPARSIVNMLKRKFNNDGLAFKVYASSDKVLTIIKAESKPAPGKKK